MKLLHLSATNFMPYRERLSIDFPRDDSRNIMIVLGDNMRGKTSLLNALRWGFYGSAIDRHSRSIPLNLIINKDAALVDDWRIDVTLKFEHGGDQFELRRTADRKRLIASPSKDADFQVDVHLQKNGNVVSGDQVDAEINLVAPEQISRFFLFDGELLQEYEELLIEGSEQGRKIKETIEQVLGVPALTKGRDELKTMLREAQKKQTQALAQIESMQGAAKESARLAEELETREADLGKLVDRLDQTRARREELEEELDAAATLLALGERLKSARSQIATNKEAIDTKTNERMEVIAKGWQDLVGSQLAAKRKVLRDRQGELLNQNKDHAVLTNRLKETRRLLETAACPTCEQSISDEKKDYFSTIAANLEDEVSRQTDATSELQKIHTTLGRIDGIRVTGAGDRIRQIDRDLRTATIAMQKAENEVAELEDKIESSDQAELSRKKRERDEKLREEGRLTDDISEVKGKIQKANENLAVLQARIDGSTAGRSDKAMQKVKLIASLHEVFSRSIEKLRDQLRASVQEKASAAFKEMTTQKAYRGLSINENYGLSIVDSSERNVALRSAGAEQVVALSLIDGLNRTGRSDGPVVMDTPFGRLDAQHRDNILQYLPKVTSQFILLVHSGEIRPETDLASVKDKIGVVYRIEEISESQSKIERAVL